MNIIKVDLDSSEIISLIISESNKDVAKRFGLTIENCPKHPSFCTIKWVAADFEMGADYFLFEDNGIYKGCVAFEKAEENTAYLNRLSVLPDFRRSGIGEKLVDHIISYAKKFRVEKISIGIIAANIELKKWYNKLGFDEKETVKLTHLPFDVTYMIYNIK
ncbi:MAG: GNAT family N-acetyltransferase [Deltaproteobacteria bacterium]|nr:GNAT family N-acetyltransferase [Deltaproteobacteria bacterium]